MADHIYKKIELTGSSTIGIEDAIRKAIARASETLHHLEWFEVTETRGWIEDGEVKHFQVTLKIGFRLVDDDDEDEDEEEEEEEEDDEDEVQAEERVR